MMSAAENRRPLKTRSSHLAQSTAKWLSRKNITPNQISIVSIFFAAGAGASLFIFALYPLWFLPLIAALMIQGRLLCNLFDGMVAVEGGKSTPAGELFNDMPDRIADSLILVALGYASFVPELGWAAALTAVLTAYTRTLATSVGAPTDFCGPMAKQHRMALVTFSCLISLISSPGYVFLTTLVIIIAGSIITSARRIRRAYRFLENK